MSWQRRRRRDGFRIRYGTRRRLLGVLIGIVVTVVYFAYVEDTLPTRLFDVIIPDVATETPSRIEVERRAEAVESKGLIVAFGSAFCVDAPGLIAEAKNEWDRDFGDVTSAELDEVDADFFTGLRDTRLAMEMLDFYEDLIEDLRRACR